MVQKKEGRIQGLETDPIALVQTKDFATAAEAMAAAKRAIDQHLEGMGMTYQEMMDDFIQRKKDIDSNPHLKALGRVEAEMLSIVLFNLLTKLRDTMEGPQ